MAMDELYTRSDFDRIPQLARFPRSEIDAMKAVSAVFPFRVNRFVVEELIDWDQVPDDPLFRLTFPQRGMLSPEDFAGMLRRVVTGAPESELRRAATDIQLRLNPHPAQQMELNVPRLGGRVLPGIQHKYRETVLFFPAKGQTCHSYCTYCFRWPQFVGLKGFKFSAQETGRLAEYLAANPSVSDVLITGGDPLIMKTEALARYLEPLLECDNLTSIRIGTKALAFWPYRFTTDTDADALLALFERVLRAGKHLALMAHTSHPRELAHPVAQAAVRRILGTGAVIRCQSPLIRHVNDRADLWARMWSEEVRLGMVPYYMFIERDTGASAYFGVPLHRAYRIFSDAYRQVSGLARTVRGPSMSATPGKLLIDGVVELAGQKVFALHFAQARQPEWVNRPFFAAYDDTARWIDDLRPAFGEDEFFYEPGMRALLRRKQGDKKPLALVTPTVERLTRDAS